MRRRYGCNWAKWALLATWAGACPALAQTPETLPPLVVPASAQTSTTPGPIPLTLDTVLRLAQDQNGQVRLARLRVEEACLKQQDLGWAPQVTVGPSYARHEGGIQDFNGRLVRSSYGSFFGGLELRARLDLREQGLRRIEAERASIQRQGDLSKLTYEQMLDASTTYVDLLAALAALDASREAERRLDDVLRQAQTLARIDPGLEVEAVRIESERYGQRLIARKLADGADSARLKLVYVLGLDGQSTVDAVDALAPFRLVDASLGAETLVDQALRAGPGVAELERLVALVDRLHADAGKGRWLPTVEVTALEGAFGAGPGSRSAWDNRFDLGVHLRWSVNDLLGQGSKVRLVDNQREQARLAHQDLRSKLTLGVRQGLQETRASAELIALADDQIRHAESSFRLSETRLRENVKGRSPSEVLMAIRTAFAARASRINAVRDFDKAQLRLFALTGIGSPHAEPRP